MRLSLHAEDSAQSLVHARQVLLHYIELNPEPRFYLRRSIPWTPEVKGASLFMTQCKRTLEGVFLGPALVASLLETLGNPYYSSDSALVN